jgi:hypothetical protein
LNAEACVLGQCVDGNIDIPSIDLGTNIAHASTLDGVSVLGAQVVGYGTYSLGAGATVTVNAPDKLAVDGTLQADKTLAGSSAEPLLSVAIGAEQFLPLVGQALHSEVGPFGYTLLSVSPEFSAGVYEHLTFDPHVNVTLHFSEPMLRPDGTIGNDVTFRAGDTISLTPASVGTLLGQVQVTPTFTLENTFHNDTGLFVDGRVNVEALKIDTPEIGPLISESIELGTVELPPLFSGSFGVNMGSITTDTIGLTRQGNAADLALATAAGLIDSEGFGFADIGFGRQGVENVHGRFFMGDLLDPNDLQEQQSYFLADEDVFNQFGLNLGRVFCVVCFDIASPLVANPLLAFDSGEDGLGSIYLSDLSTFPTIPTPAEVRATDPAFSPVPEPSTVLLLAVGLPLVAYGRRRQTTAGRAR